MNQTAVQEYYGRVLKNSSDLKTQACCVPGSIPERHRNVLNQIHPAVLERFFGCGAPIPELIRDRHILDLGCGSGRDVYLLAGLAGPQARIIGLDMTAEQLEVARRYEGYHTDVFGLSRPNFSFCQGYMEDLRSAGIADSSMDLVISNCVINLSPDKPQVFREILRVLKPGGELYFSDIFSNRRIPLDVAQDPLLYNECLGGALYFEDFRRIMAELGILDFRVVHKTTVPSPVGELADKLGNISFESITIRLFKLPLEDRCEDYGQMAIYRGSIPGYAHRFDLDDHHAFERQKPMAVCGNTADMLSRTAYGEHFEILGEKNTHYGLFACGPAEAASGKESSLACC